MKKNKMSKLHCASRPPLLRIFLLVLLVTGCFELYDAWVGGIMIANVEPSIVALAKQHLDERVMEVGALEWRKAALEAGFWTGIVHASYVPFALRGSLGIVLLIGLAGVYCRRKWGWIIVLFQVSIIGTSQLSGQYWWPSWTLWARSPVELRMALEPWVSLRMLIFFLWNVGIIFLAVKSYPNEK